MKILSILCVVVGVLAAFLAGLTLASEVIGIWQMASSVPSPVLAVAIALFALGVWVHPENVTERKVVKLQRIKEENKRIRVGTCH